MGKFKLGVCALLVSLSATGCANGGNDNQGDASTEPQQSKPFIEPEALTGSYLLVVSTTIAPRIPVMYEAQLEAELSGEELVLRLRQRPLSKLDRKTPVGPWTDWMDGHVDAEGHFDAGPLSLVIPSEANALTGLETEVEITLSASLPAMTADAPAEFLCGEVTGRIVGPIPLDDLSGSTFTVRRVADLEQPETFPEPEINCDHDPARPL